LVNEVNQIMIRFRTILILAAFAGIPAHAQPWVDLFNGKDLKGWEKLDGSAEYRVEDGMVIGRSGLGTPNTFLATIKMYGDFILEYDMKMDRGLNSGVQFRSSALHADGRKRVNGYQVECDDHDDRPWAGGIYEEDDRGWLYPMTYNPEAYKANKRGEWNHFRVEAIGSNIRTYLNGVSFANLVDDARKEGFIALQVHRITGAELEGKEIRWRNIRIITEEPERYVKTDVTLAPEVSYLDHRLTPLQFREGWRLLWDGQSARGWKGAGSDSFPHGDWDLSDGMLTVLKSTEGETPHTGDIVTVEKFGNFILELDFRITEGANSGIKYFVDPDPVTGERSDIGCEYQILDDAKHPDANQGVQGNRTLASLYDLIPADALLCGEDNTKKRFNGVGKWNRARIEVRGPVVSHFLNGVKVVEYQRGTQMWKALVAKSKYNEYPAFGETDSGHILLQDHGDEVNYKNIRILEL
jgi:hypothetical protein